MEGAFAIPLMVDQALERASLGNIVHGNQSKLGVGENASPLESANVRSRLKLGLFSYPVLQAADVLLYEYVRRNVPERVPPSSY